MSVDGNNEQSFVVTDRYGGNYPDPATMCKGQCDGMGYYPQNVSDDDASDEERAAIDFALAAGAEPDEFGTIFIKCPDCDGTGKAKVPEDV